MLIHHVYTEEGDIFEKTENCSKGFIELLKSFKRSGKITSTHVLFVNKQFIDLELLKNEGLSDEENTLFQFAFPEFFTKDFINNKELNGNTELFPEQVEGKFKPWFMGQIDYLNSWPFKFLDAISKANNIILVIYTTERLFFAGEKITLNFSIPFLKKLKKMMNEDIIKELHLFTISTSRSEKRVKTLLHRARMKIDESIINGIIESR
ncbi:MAG: hypothetical protein ACTSVI_02475 [Promethearchaeota archaeon]